MYQAYMLRCWREEQAAPDGSSRWRFSVEEVLHERRQRGFTSLEALFAFLEAALAGGEGETATGSRQKAL